MEIGQGLSAIKTAVELTRSLRDAAKSGTVSHVEIAGRIAEVYDYIADAKEALLDAKETIFELQGQVAKNRQYSFHDSVTWKQQSDGEDGPYCPICEATGLEMRLPLNTVVDQTGDVFHMECPQPHGGNGIGRPPHYKVPKSLIPAGRYSTL